VLLIPIALLRDRHAQGAPPVWSVSTTVEIAAPPDTVWNSVVTFRDIGGEHEWPFRCGIACPMRATIQGSGVGAVRHCEFTTGPFVEPITVWDEPRLLAFDVTSQPEPMEEMGIFGPIDSPHLHDTLVSKRGQFLLEPLDGGRRTRLTGTTWYSHTLAPTFYWKAISDAIIHRIHLRVLRHIRAKAEGTRNPPSRIDQGSVWGLVRTAPSPTTRSK